MAGPSSNNNQHDELRREINQACENVVGIQAGMEALRALVDRTAKGLAPPD